MIEIGINPNTNIPSVAIRLNGYFGLGRDGIKLVDSDTVFPCTNIKLAGMLPITAFDTLQTEKKNTGEKPEDRDPKTGRFLPNNSGAGGGRPKGSYKNPITDPLKELLNQKHYKLKDTGEMVVANEIFAERMLDRAIEKMDPRFIEIILDRVEGKVTQGVRLSGALNHGTIPDKDIEKLKQIFPDI